MVTRAGVVVLFGSGETSASAHGVYDWLFSRSHPGVRIAILETPAGFEPNSAHVAGQVADYFEHHLRNYHPKISVIPARKRGTALSPDDAALASPLLHADLIFLGPGSPTYAARQLRDSLAWEYVLARHRMGAMVVLASAAAVAASAMCLPVYEIYKAGADLHWQKGLDLFGTYGLSLVVIPHWDNTEGGDTLDTSRCYMGRARFEQLRSMLGDETTVVGIDEHTALVVDPSNGTGHVMGRRGLTYIRRGQESFVANGQSFSLSELGQFRLPAPQDGISAEVWHAAESALSSERAAPEESAHTPPPDVLELVQSRENARRRRDWNAADDLRTKIAARGWHIADLPEGPQIAPLDNHDTP